jgi:hypothetical protein
MMLAAAKARSEHDVGFARQDGLEQPRKLAGVILQVGILDDDVITRGLGKPGAECGPFALILVVVEGAEPAIGCGKLFQPIASPVGREVVYDDDFRIETDCVHSRKNAVDCANLVKNRNDHRQQRRSVWLVGDWHILILIRLPESMPCAGD